MTPIPVGLIGLGKHGERYLRHLTRDVPELRVALVTRRDARAGREIARAAGARFVADFREVARSPEIEAVIAVLPPADHLEIARIAAAAGKALLVEKPLSVDVASAREIASLYEAEAAPGMIAHTLRFDRVVRAVAERIEALGPLRQITLSQRFEPSTLDWLDDPARSGGGMILHTAVHSFDLLRLFSAREPSAVAATASRTVTRRTEDGFAAAVRFEPPSLVASVGGSRATRARSAAIEVTGERAQLVGDHQAGTLWMLREGGAREAIDTGPPIPTVRETLRAFARALRGEPVAIPLREGVRSVACVDACYRSIASGAFETIEAG